MYGRQRTTEDLHIVVVTLVGSLGLNVCVDRLIVEVNLRKIYRVFIVHV